MKIFPISDARNELSMVRSIKGADIRPKDISSIIAFANANNIAEVAVSSANGFSKSIVYLKRLVENNCECVFFCSGKIVSKDEALKPSYKHFILGCITEKKLSLYGYYPGEVRS